MGNLFLKKKSVMIETFQKKFRKERGTFLFQICFRNQFCTSGSGQTKNMPITPIGVIGVFSVWPLPKGRNWFQKHIWYANVHISILIFLGERFNHPKKKNSKIDFPLYFKILHGQWEGVILEIPYGLFRVFSTFL